MRYLADALESPSRPAVTFKQALQEIPLSSRSDSPRVVLCAQKIVDRPLQFPVPLAGRCSLECGPCCSETEFDAALDPSASESTPPGDRQECRNRFTTLLPFSHLERRHAARRLRSAAKLGPHFEPAILRLDKIHELPPSRKPPGGFIAVLNCRHERREPFTRDLLFPQLARRIVRDRSPLLRVRSIWRVMPGRGQLFEIRPVRLAWRRHPGPSTRHSAPGQLPEVPKQFRTDRAWRGRKDTLVCTRFVCASRASTSTGSGSGCKGNTCRQI